MMYFPQSYRSNGSPPSHPRSEVSSQVAGLTSPSPHDLVSLGQTGKKASGGGNNYDMLVTSALKLEDLSSSLVKSNVTTNE